MLHKNLIAGEWLVGESEIENRNPSDVTDLIGIYAQASVDQLEATLDQAQKRSANGPLMAWNVSRPF